MSTNLQLAEAIERYVNGEMTGDELLRFEQYRKDNAEVDHKITEHKYFAGLLKQYRDRVALEAKLNAIHDEIDVHALVEEMTVHPSGIVRMWRNHHSKISVAASIAMFVVVGAMFFTGYFNNNKDKQGYEKLGKELKVVKDDQRRLVAIVKSIPKTSPEKPHLKIGPGNYQGTGFALSQNGYIVTNQHVISNSYDSIYVQDATGSSYKAKLVYSEPLYDIAILKITDKSFTNLPALPYNFKRTKSEIGEEVYAIGYSEGDSPVFDKGYVSSINGYLSDSSEYRVSIPLNPGNSGGPLINARGNVIGIVTGRRPQTAGASYAKKSGYLYKALRNVPADSLSSKLTLNNKNTLAKLDPVKQYKKLQNYVFMVKVY